MRLFDFLMILDSIVIGLGLAAVLEGMGEFLRARGRIRIHGVHTIVVVLIFLALVQHWWGAWGLREIESLSFPALLLFLSGPVLLFLLAYLAFPETVEDRDLEEYYYTYAPQIWGIGALYLLSTILFRPLALASELVRPENLVRAAALLLCVTLASTRRAGVHRWGVGAAAILLVLYISFFVFRLTM